MIVRSRWRLILKPICQTLLARITNRGGLELCIPSVCLGYLLTVYLYCLSLLVDPNVFLAQLFFLISDFELQREQRFLELAYLIILISNLGFHMCRCS